MPTVAKCAHRRSRTALIIKSKSVASSTNAFSHSYKAMYPSLTHSVLASLRRLCAFSDSPLVEVPPHPSNLHGILHARAQHQVSTAASQPSFRFFLRRHDLQGGRFETSQTKSLRVPLTAPTLGSQAEEESCRFTRRSRHSTRVARAQHFDPFAGTLCPWNFSATVLSPHTRRPTKITHHAAQ